MNFFIVKSLQSRLERRLLEKQRFKRSFSPLIVVSQQLQISTQSKVSTVHLNRAKSHFVCDRNIVAHVCWHLIQQHLPGTTHGMIDDNNNAAAATKLDPFVVCRAANVSGCRAINCAANRKSACRWSANFGSKSRHKRQLYTSLHPSPRHLYVTVQGCRRIKVQHCSAIDARVLISRDALALTWDVTRDDWMDTTGPGDVQK